MSPSLVLQRDYDFDPVVVWDALADDVLLEGWLADAHVDPVAGGEVRMRWRERHHGADFRGEVEALRPPEELVMGDGRQSIAFRLESLPGGTAAIAGGPRGRSTRLTIEVALDGDAERPVHARAHWAAHLEALADLLHGHPVVWSEWEADYGGSPAGGVGRAVPGR